MVIHISCLATAIFRQKCDRNVAVECSSIFTIRFVNNFRHRVQESWLAPLIADSLIGISGYEVIRRDRPDASGYGGVITYVRNE